MPYCPIQVEYLHPFVESTVRVFRTMLNQEVRPGSFYLKCGFQPAHEITGVVGLTGMAKGLVLISLSQAAALAVTGILLNDHYETLNHDVVDAVGELANMITGCAKAQLEELQMSIGLPSVVVGNNHAVVFPTGAQPLGIPFETAIGPFCIEVTLVTT